MLFCYDITSSNATVKAFKLAVPSTEVIKMTDANLWPRRVAIRPWRDGAVTQIQRQDVPQSDYLIGTSLQNVADPDRASSSIVYSVSVAALSELPGMSCAHPISAAQRPPEKSVFVIEDHSTSGDRGICDESFKSLDNITDGVVTSAYVASSATEQEPCDVSAVDEECRVAVAGSDLSNKNVIESF